jgi:hypothetical protein
MSALAEVLPAERKPRKVLQNRFRLTEQARNSWAVVPADGTPYEDLFAPEYWAHVAASVRPGDLIEVRAEDGSYFALLYAVAVQRQAVAVIELLKKDLHSVRMPVIESGIAVEFKGPIRKWSVIRTKDNVIVSDKHDNRLAADNAAAEYLKVISR